MPNQLSDKMQRVTVVLPKTLVKKLGRRAVIEERSRSQVILRILRNEMSTTRGKQSKDND